MFTGSIPGSFYDVTCSTKPRDTELDNNRDIQRFLESPTEEDKKTVSTLVGHMRQLMRNPIMSLNTSFILYLCREEIRACAYKSEHITWKFIRMWTGGYMLDVETPTESFQSECHRDGTGHLFFNGQKWYRNNSAMPKLEPLNDIAKANSDVDWSRTLRIMVASILAEHFPEDATMDLK